MLKKEVIFALKELNKNGYEAYVVGGAVRDFLMNVDIHDYDITTSALPDQIEELFKDYKVFNTNKRFGTITVIINHLPLEITTYRTKEDYSDHRKPNSLKFTNKLEEDITRRDFTINSLLCDANLQIIDLLNGQEDLKNHLIRSINDPEMRFEEDALRILRAIRFKAQLGFEIEEKTNIAIFKQAKLLDYISIERKRDELFKILKLNRLAVLTEYKTIFNRFIDYDDINPLIAKTNQLALKLFWLNQDFDYSKLKLANSDLALIKEIKTYDDIDNLIKTFANVKNLDLFFEYHKLVNNIDYHEAYLNNQEYIVNIKQLKLNGSDLMKLGFQGQEIGAKINEILSLIWNKKLHNNHEEIITYIEEK